MRRQAIEEASTTGIDLLGNPSITTPAGFIIAALVYIGNQYFRYRQETRTDAEARGATESGIVETSKATLAVARETIQQMQVDARETRAETKRREREYLKRIETLEAQNEELDNDNRRLRQRLGSPSHPLGHTPSPAPRVGTEDGPSGSTRGSGTETGGGRRRRYRDEA